MRNKTVKALQLLPPLVTQKPYLNASLTDPSLVCKAPHVQSLGHYTDLFHCFSNFRELVNTKYTESWSQFGKQGYPSSIHEVSPLALERLSMFRAVS